MTTGQAQPTEAPEDADLLSAIRGGDANAFEALYDRHAGYVIAAGMRILASRDDAEEVTHELFRQIWEGSAVYDPARGRFATWIFAIARNRCIDRIRAGARRAGLVEAAAREGEQGASASNPEVDALSAERRRRVRAALDALPNEQREAVETCFHRGLTHREAAEHLSVPLGTLKSRVKMAMDKLRPNLRELSDEP